MPSSPSGVNPSDTKTRLAAVTSASPTTMSQSMMGLAARPGTDVLPTCSIATTGTPASSIAVAYRSRSIAKRSGQARSYSTTVITGPPYGPATPSDRELPAAVVPATTAVIQMCRARHTEPQFLRPWSSDSANGREAGVAWARGSRLRVAASASMRAPAPHYPVPLVLRAFLGLGELFREVRGQWLIAEVFAGERAGAVRHRAQVDGVPDDLGLRDLCPDQGAPAGHRLGAEDAAAARGQVGHDRADVLVGNHGRELVDWLEQLHLRLGGGVPE